MKEIALILSFFVAMIQLIAGLQVVMYTAEVTTEFRDSYDDVKNGDTDALTDFVENRAEDLKDIAIDEAQDAIIDSTINDLSND